MLRSINWAIILYGTKSGSTTDTWTFVQSVEILFHSYRNWFVSQSRLNPKKAPHHNKRKTCRSCNHGDGSTEAPWVSSRSVKWTPQTATGARVSFKFSTQYPDLCLRVNETGNLICDFWEWFSSALITPQADFTNKIYGGLYLSYIQQNDIHFFNECAMWGVCTQV